MSDRVPGPAVGQLLEGGVMPDRPYDCELEYLESTGTQYIDTGVALNNSWSYTLVAALTELVSEKNKGRSLCGARDTDQTSVSRVVEYYYGNGVNVGDKIVIQRGGFNSDLLIPADTNWHTYSATPTTLSIDGYSVSAGSVVQPTSSFYLFVDNVNRTANHNVFSLCRIKSFVMMDGQTAVLDLIPVLKDGVGYMYDKVSGTLFGNAGTGSFVLGPRVGPMFEPPFHVRRLEWLESTGTQYVDTGILGGSDLVAKARVYWPYQNQTQGIVFGSLYKPQGSVSIRYMLQRHNSRASFYTDTNTTPAAITVSSGWYDTELNAPGGFVSVNSTVVSKTVASYLMPKPTMYLFARHIINEDISSDGGVDNISVAGVRISSFSLERNSVLVRDFVPVMEDGVGYLFDRVSGRMFGNSGTGSFVLGPMVGDPYLLPSWARKVEYLESTGTQYVDTGVVATSRCRIECDWTPTSLTGSSRLMGVVTISGVVESSRFQMLLSSTKIGFGIGDGFLSVGAASAPTWSIGAKNASVVDALNLAASNNGTSYAPSSGLYSADISAKSIYVFSVNGKTDTTANASVRISRAAIYDGSTLVRSFVPCRILDVGYLFDEISGRFYGNNGTGSFVLGPDVREGVVPTRLNPFGISRRMEEIRRIEYLESTGTQWIDTGVYADDTTKMTVRGTFFNEYSDGNASTRLGSRKAAFTSGFDALYIGTNTFRIDLGTGTSTTAQWSTGINKVLTEITIDAGTKAASLKAIDGTTASHTYDSSMTFADAPSLTLFCFTSGTDRLPGFHMRISSCQLWQNGTLVRDFVPVAIGSVGYLLDRVSGRLFGNSGTGDFVLGPDIVPVEYVRSNGGPYVRTGIVPSNSTRWDMKFSLDTTNAKMGVDVWEKQFRVLGRGGSFSTYSAGTTPNGRTWNTGVQVNEVSFDLPNKRIAVNGTTYTFTGSYVSNDLPLILLGSSTGVTSVDARASTLYWCKIYESGTLVRDFQPVRVGTEGALYDKVTNTVFRSATSTPLVAGPDARHPAG